MQLDIKPDICYFVQRFLSFLADRAKSIKTKATVNESPTEKLIRELREENKKMMEMLKKAGLAAGIGEEGEEGGEAEGGGAEGGGGGGGGSGVSSEGMYIV